MNPGTVVFTDLDGTLLDSETYSFAGALPALEQLRRRGIPLIPCTSKTAAETKPLMERLRLDGPYIVENGAGVYLPARSFPAVSSLGEGRGSCRLVRLAVGYDEILRGMTELREESGIALRGFHEMSAGEIAERTGLSLEQAALAKIREFDEPFEMSGADGARLEAIAGRRGLRLSKGGRFWHLHGDSDKGRALELVKDLYRSLGGPVRTIAAGDSALDLPMLEAADVAVVVAKPGGAYDPLLLSRLRNPVLSRIPGPEGWAAAVGAALERRT